MGSKIFSTKKKKTKQNKKKDLLNVLKARVGHFNVQRNFSFYSY